ncbi:MAG: DUF11 domain-containing protein [Gemmatimonadales bacterium]|nr:DUF11 domain-containing protein [Gemmatimonadales bacterium]
MKIRSSARIGMFGLTLAVLVPICGHGASIAVDGTTCKLGDAILSANGDTAVGGCTAGAGADTLVLGADVVLAAGVTAAVEGGPSGLPEVASAITIQAGGGSTVERTSALPCGSQEPTAFRMVVVAAAGDLTLDGLTLRNGCIASDALPVTASGGAVLVLSGGRLRIEGSTFEGNRVFGAEGSTGPDGPARGGAVAVLGGSVGVAGALFTNNQALGTDAHGGAIAVDGGEVDAIERTQFLGNRVGEVPSSNLGGPASGGALSLRGADAGVLAHLLFRDNVAGQSQGSATGGAIEIAGGRLHELRDSLFAANIAQAESGGIDFQPMPGRGGGLANFGTIDAILRTTFADNQALGHATGEGRGGGLDNRGRIDRIVSCTFVGNVAQGGVGLHAIGGNGYGGGVANVGEIGLVVASTFAGNRAVQSIFTAFAMGGGVYNATDDEAPDTGVTLQNNLLADNEAADGSDCWSAGGQASDGWNLVQAPDPSCSFLSPGDIVGADPLLLPTADNGCAIALPGGGCPPTVEVAANSPAVDGGLCSASGTEIDARGAVRPVDLAGVPNAPGGDGCDIGAFERDGVLAAVHLGVNVAESIDPVASGWSAGNLVYTAAVASLGSATATGIAVAVALPLPTGVGLDSVTPSIGSWDGATWTVPTLPSGAHATLTFVLTVGFGTAGGADVLGLSATVTAATAHDGELASDVETTSVIEGVFFDGFESHDTLAWSLTVGDS